MMRRILRAIALGGFALAFAAPAAALDILLTNDDGWDSIGIQTMKTRLEADGHSVTLVAPSTNRSGSSASLVFDVVAVTQESANEYSVDGTPATCVLLGLSALMPQPADLVVSGTNHGANLGTATPFSGTVGATIAAISSAGGRVPALAFSTDAPVDPGTEPEFTEHFQNVADFAVVLIDLLEAGSPDLLPRNLALSVNYPPLAPADISGVTVNAQARSSNGQIVYVEAAPGLYVPDTEGAPPEPEVSQSDRESYDAGFITIVPIDGDYTARFN